MIRSITGTVTSTDDTKIVVDVRGIGYLIYVPANHTYLPSKEVTVHTYQAVRETALDLYGFATTDQLELFELLLTLPKIGPKSAATIMSQADVSTLKTAIINEDPVQLTKMSGIGKKTAEKIVAGLQDKIEFDINDITNANTPEHTFQTDAIDALVALGYAESEARKTVQALPETITTSNEAVRTALQTLGQSL